MWELGSGDEWWTGWGAIQSFFAKRLTHPTPDGGGGWRMENGRWNLDIGYWILDIGYWEGCGLSLCSIGGFPPTGSNICSTFIITQNHRSCDMFFGEFCLLLLPQLGGRLRWKPVAPKSGERVQPVTQPAGGYLDRTYVLSYYTTKSATC